MITIFDSELTANGSKRKRIYIRYADSVKLRMEAKRQALLDIRNEN